MTVLFTCKHGHHWIPDSAYTDSPACPMCGAPPFRPDRQAEVAAGRPPKREANSPLILDPLQRFPEQFARYRVIKRIGHGGMAAVYLAVDTQLERQVALKVPSVHSGDSAETRDRFFGEARVAARLQHPNVCPIFDFGVWEGVPYIAMAFIDGILLSDLLAVSGPLPDRAAAVIVRKICMAMDTVHGLGIIHRDLKTSNIMIDSRKEPILLDFGLARVLSNTRRHTISGVLVGTVAYMAPEQLAGHSDAASVASDIYSAGVILYELLTGHLPFDGTLAAVIGQILTQEAPAPSVYCPGLCPKIEAICQRAMAKNAPERYGSMSDFAGALAMWLQDSLSRRPAAPPPGATAARKEGNDNENSDGAVQTVASRAPMPNAPLADLQALKSLAGGEADAETYRLQGSKVATTRSKKISHARAARTRIPDQMLVAAPLLVMFELLCLITVRWIIKSFVGDGIWVVDVILLVCGCAMWLGGKIWLLNLGTARGLSRRAVFLVPLYWTLLAMRDWRRSMIPTCVLILGLLLMMAGISALSNNPAFLSVLPPRTGAKPTASP